MTTDTTEQQLAQFRRADARRRLRRWRGVNAEQDRKRNAEQMRRFRARQTTEATRARDAERKRLERKRLRTGVPMRTVPTYSVIVAEDDGDGLILVTRLTREEADQWRRSRASYSRNKQFVHGKGYPGEDPEAEVGETDDESDDEPKPGPRPGFRFGPRLRGYERARRDDA